MRFSIYLLLMLGMLVSCNQKAKKSMDAKAALEVKGTDTTTTTWNLISEKSTLNWKGFKPGGEHFGTVNITSGKLFMKDSMPVGGKFTIDMNSIVANDLEGAMKEKLENHLKSADFFETEKYPTAMFEIVKITKSDDTTYPYDVTGNLTIKGVTKSITFKAKYEMKDGQLYASSAVMHINRTNWGVNHMSKNIFKELKDKFVNDDLEIQIETVFAP